MEPVVAARFTSELEFGTRFRECIARSSTCLQLFDPDFRVFPLGLSDVDAALRQFLANGGRMQLAMHRSDRIERAYPRFLRLLRDFGHLIECRVTGRQLHALTDSFCIGDGVHLVRRFHSDHMRGEAAYNAPAAAEISLARFHAIWVESSFNLRTDTTIL